MSEIIIPDYQEVEKHTDTFTSFDGTKIYYEVRGTPFPKTPPIIMVYGISCLINHWRHQIKYFSQTHQTIVLDYRGHHKSGTPDNLENLSIESMAKDLLALTEHLNIKKATFCSHSFGSQILLQTYLLSPEVFANIIFINGFANNPLQKLFEKNLPNYIFEILRQSYHSYPEPVGKAWRFIMNNSITQRISALTGGFNIHLTSIKDIEIYARGVGAMDVGTFTHLFEQMLEFDGSSIAETVSVPTQIIGGQKDNITPKDYQINLKELISNSELSIVPFGTHCTQLDMPEFVNLKIEKFLHSC